MSDGGAEYPQRTESVNHPLLAGIVSHNLHLSSSNTASQLNLLDRQPSRSFLLGTLRVSTCRQATRQSSSRWRGLRPDELLVSSSGYQADI